MNRVHASRAAVLLFLIGLFSQTQVNLGGKLGISEFAMITVAPLVFLKSIRALRQDGSLYYFCLILFWLAGAVFVDLYTNNYLPFMLRGIAVPITVFSASICIYMLLRRNLDNLKWLLLGVAFSGVISVFVFQRGSAGDAASEYGVAAGIERVVGYKLFWVTQLTTWLTLPIAGWYLKVSKVYSVISLSFLAVFNLASGGRSAFLVAAVSLLFVVFAGKTRQSISFFRRHAVTILLLLGVLGIVASFTYKFAVTHGYMGEEEERKYERNTAHGSSAVDLLVSGRGEFFIGLWAALDNPIMGHGSVAIDDHGYVLDYMSKYGAPADYERMIKWRSEFGARIIPSHSHIITYWLWHGIGGLAFWLCAIALALRTLFARMDVYPPWFGYFVVTIPFFLWDVFFSPFGKRVEYSALLVTFLLIKVVKMRQSRELRYKA